ncbi:hypothetical protein [Microbacterium sp. P02]|uniref:hypothetical protein n=1 Tax=Microbacterium sp. P02 TaxID=3366260 RepID=UPI00366BD8C3
MSNNDFTKARTTSPWWGNPRVAPLLQQAESDGAEIKNKTDYYGPDDDNADWDEDFLNVKFPALATAGVFYDPDAKFWRLEVDSVTRVLDSWEATADMHVRASQAVILAARLCVALNYAD